MNTVGNIRTIIRAASTLRRAVTKPSQCYGSLGCYTRCFTTISAKVTDATYHKELVTRAKAAYGGNKEVDAAMDDMLNKHRLVLFMEGSMDHPKSLCAGNLAKIFTALQIVDLHTVDLLTHPEIMGYLCTHMKENVRNVIFKNAMPILDYDQIMELFKKGTLLQALETRSKPPSKGTHKHFKDMLPIANY
ncbi:hypothetical protein BBOV_III011770 [Babesia bovis T2Bo]|uniref:Uncharacterized protein n=1 Tax=Babesia bovis TaxID=5865 RepID=A7AQ95_BABBO|nr:hypothetical protein BBOV_III011770 [Babesia bovis T2Bo]EDO08729.1 hypothetical protein BBOV_III011770 [Babesia bovis T2Bo]|eukprot:XP_001612297.1 hypothetical protein [Babesia bovis T2Bo]